MGGETQIAEGKSALYRMCRFKGVQTVLSPCEGLCVSTPLPLGTVIDHGGIDSGYQISDACCRVKCVYASRGSS